jgi:hypothetical protein
MKVNVKDVGTAESEFRTWWNPVCRHWPSKSLRDSHGLHLEVVLQYSKKSFLSFSAAAVEEETITVRIRAICLAVDARGAR